MFENDWPFPKEHSKESIVSSSSSSKLSTVPSTYAPDDLLGSPLSVVACSMKSRQDSSAACLPSQALLVLRHSEIPSPGPKPLAHTRSEIHFPRNPPVEQDLPRSSTTAADSLWFQCPCCRRSLPADLKRRCTNCKKVVCSECSQSRVLLPNSEKRHRVCDSCNNRLKQSRQAELRRNSTLKKRHSLPLSVTTMSPTSCSSPNFHHMNDSLELDRMAEGVRQLIENADFPSQDMAFDQLVDVGILGRGASGQVLLMRHTPSAVLYALKKIQLTVDLRMEAIQRELQALQTFHHPNLVAGQTAFLHDNALHVVMEYMDTGSLRDIARSGAPVPPGLLAYIAHEVLQGLVFLHCPDPALGRPPMLHRDVKPANVLVNGRGEVKIADFGIVTACDSGSNNAAVHSFAGTGQYMSPERLRDDSYCEAADVWSFGITLAELTLGHLPFNDAKCLNFMGLYSEIMQCTGVTLPETFPPCAVEFINSCLVQEPAKRATTLELQHHPWLATRHTQTQFAKWLEAANIPRTVSSESITSDHTPVQSR